MRNLKYAVTKREAMDTASGAQQKTRVKKILTIALIVVVAIGLVAGAVLVLTGQVSVRVVESGSMCVPYDGGCEGLISLNHPFAQTLHKGDIIVIQAVDPKDLNTNYPNSDIIVYKNPTNPSATPIVHRIVTSYTEDGVLYFQTKGDGNPSTKWPNPVSQSDYDSRRIWSTGQGVPENLVEGRVVMRIPYFGWVTLILRDTPWGIPLIVALIIVLLVIEFVLPAIKRKPTPNADASPSEEQPKS